MSSSVRGPEADGVDAGAAVPRAGSWNGLTPTFWWLWAGWLISACANFVFPFLAFFLAARNLPPSQIGFIISAFGAGSLIAAPCAGVLADRVGRRPTILVALLVSATTAALTAFLTSPVTIAITVFLFGIASQAVNAPFQAIVADVVPSRLRNGAFDLAYWAQNVGTSLSLAAGGALASRGLALPFLLDAGTTLAFAAIVFHKVPETRPAGSPVAAQGIGYGAVLRDRRFVALLALHAVFATALWQLHAGLPIDMALRGTSPGTFGAVLSVNTILVAVLQPFASRLTNRLHPGAVLAGGALLVGLGFGGYALCASPTDYALATALLTLGEIAYLPVIGALAVELAPAALRGRYAGALGLAFGVAKLLAPIAGSTLLQARGTAALWLACLALCSAVSVGHAISALASPLPRLAE